MRLQLQTPQFWLRRQHLTKNLKALSEQIRLFKERHFQAEETNAKAWVEVALKGQRQAKRPMHLEHSWWEGEGRMRAIAAIGHADTCRKHVTSLLSLPLSAIAWEEITTDSLWHTISLYLATGQLRTTKSVLSSTGSITWQVGSLSVWGVCKPPWEIVLARTCPHSNGCAEGKWKNIMFKAQTQHWDIVTSAHLSPLVSARSKQVHSQTEINQWGSLLHLQWEGLQSHISKRGTENGD